MELLICHYCDKELDDTQGCFLAVTLISTLHVTHAASDLDPQPPPPPVM